MTLRSCEYWFSRRLKSQTQDSTYVRIPGVTADYNSVSTAKDQAARTRGLSPTPTPGEDTQQTGADYPGLFAGQVKPHWSSRVGSGQLT